MAGRNGLASRAGWLCALGMMLGAAGRAGAANATLFVNDTGDRSAFLTALGPGVNQTQDFSGFSPGTNLAGVQILPGVTASSNMSDLEVFSGIMAGFDVPVRTSGNAFYQLDLSSSYHALGFDIAAFNPTSPGPGVLTVFYADSTSQARNIPATNATENVPIFVGIIADTPITRVKWAEGLQSNGANEETGLDNFVARTLVPEPGSTVILLLGLAFLRRRRP